MTRLHSFGADTSESLFSRLVAVWAVVGLAGWTVALALTTEPPMTDATTALFTALALVVLVAMTASLIEPIRPLPNGASGMAVVVALAGWTVLMFHDDRWSVLTFALYAMCFAKGRTLGVVLAALVSAVWLAAWINADGPTWTLLIPFAAFAVGGIMSITIHRVGDENESQAVLISQLRETRDELAASERERGILEERARFAGEIHDTLAQGFTSIVLMSRATRRNLDWDQGLSTIEETAEENLRAARRLVAAMRPAELDRTTLAEALERQLAALDDAVHVVFTVSGTPVPVDDAVEATLLRAAQEALLNVRNHAEASNVYVTLSYIDDTIALDVHDDGIGLGDGVTDRGSLTGGQGLDALRQRAATLGGLVSIEPGPTGGSTVSVQLPVGPR